MTLNNYNHSHKNYNESAEKAVKLVNLFAHATQTFRSVDHELEMLESPYDQEWTAKATYTAFPNAASYVSPDKFANAFPV